MSNTEPMFHKILELGTTLNGRTGFSIKQEESQRQLAVAAILELIKVDLSASVGTKNSYAITGHLENLGLYTEYLLNALNGIDNTNDE
ncbi:MAG: hypothetical protein ACRCVE_13065 [Plesiomonas sp.]